MTVAESAYLLSGRSVTWSENDPSSSARRWFGGRVSSCVFDVAPPGLCASASAAGNLDASNREGQNAYFPYGQIVFGPTQ